MTVFGFGVFGQTVFGQNDSSNPLPPPPPPLVPMEHRVVKVWNGATWNHVPLKMWTGTTFVRRPLWVEPPA